jgi:Uma2 family endonuclease
MGHAASNEMLIARWTELINDPALQDLPYKIELDAEGTIKLSPADNWHGLLQARLAKTLGIALPNGEVITECSVLTEIGIRVPDLVWASPEFLSAQGDATPFTRAPEICVEVRSRWNTKKEIDEKVRAYLAAGAREAWVVGEQGDTRYFGPEGKRASSEFGVTVDLPKRSKDPAG